MSVKERRLLLVGDAGTGKSSLLRSARCEVAQEGPALPTVYYRIIPRHDGRRRSLLLSLWDVPAEGGQAARDAVYPRLDAALLVFALDSPQSLENARRVWYKQVRARCRRKIPIVLVGTKRDLRTPENGVSYQEGMRVAEKIRAYAYVECSALDPEEALYAFKFAVRSVVKCNKCNCSLM